ncbi:MAG: 30S ribosome-binding factor RbfA [Deltaproteobacteria bacterium]|nr:30S ribosome-binding factor RbfA [Deltaproteobacteria bacterium]
MTKGRSGKRPAQRSAAGGVRRADRVAAEIQRILSEELLHRVRDPRVAHVTVTRVRVNDDLRLARVWFTLLEVGEGDRGAAQKGLESAMPYLRRTVAGDLGLRHAPELAFAYDEGLASARRIDSLLKGLRTAETPPGGDGDPEGGAGG